MGCINNRSGAPQSGTKKIDHQWGGNMLWIITELPLSGYLVIAVAVHATDAAIRRGFQEL